MAQRRLFLIDSFGFIFRAYHARARSGAPPMRTGQGHSTEAVYIFNNMVRKLQKTFKPDWLAAVFESEGKTLREQEFAAYKANRTEAPPDLIEQIPAVRRVLDAMRIPVLLYPGYEADDVIGTIATKVAREGVNGKPVDVVIVSSDKDMLQLVGDRVSMLNPAKDDTWYDREKTKEYMGVYPEQIADLLALKGDSVDNIPGAPGIGDKGARDLLEQFGSVEAALDRAAEVQRKMYRASLENNRDQVMLSKRLATIERNVPIEFSLDACAVGEPDIEALKQVYKELEFNSLLRELGPSEDTREKDYARFDPAWLASLPPDAPIAIAWFPSDFDVPTVGLASTPGIAREAFPSEISGKLGAHPTIACDAKSLMVSLDTDALSIDHDVLLYSFLLDADPTAVSLDALAQRRLDLKPGPSPAAHADTILELYPALSAEVDQRGLRKVYDTIDRPLTPVLARMERTGVRIDPHALAALGGRMDTAIQQLSMDIFELAGRPFNLNSPQQLGKILFDDLGLPAPTKYGKGKTISTAADVLEELAPVYPIVAKVLEYRQIAKLKSTYVDALPAMIRHSTGRLHTSFNPAGAATGRLSSSNPNLQNIPIRTELGREIRAAFVPRDGWTILSTDYSQIELRLLAHFSQDPALIDAFTHGEDIHTRTAAEVFGVGPLMVTPDLRRNAKAVNFGIVYGISGFGLAQQLGIPRGEAELYIKSYFVRYPNVKRFMDASIEETRKAGVTRTLFGRERPIPDILSRNPSARGFAERTAINSPLQGTAADLIKLAMIAIDTKLRAGFETKMLLQVHDELLFEAPPSELDAVTAMIKSEMEGVAKLSVPLDVDVGRGPNWRDAK